MGNAKNIDQALERVGRGVVVDIVARLAGYSCTSRSRKSFSKKSFSRIAARRCPRPHNRRHLLEKRT